MPRLTVLFLLVVVAAAVTGIDIQEQWRLFTSSYKKQYASQEEEDSRRLVWESNYEYIKRHNLEADQGLHTYRLGINQFADLSHTEFMQQWTRPMKSSRVSTTPIQTVDNTEGLPQAISWKDLGYVTPVKDQGRCGSCYAFSAVGAVEGQHYKATGKLVSLSEQNILDCTRPKGNYGCDGGQMTYVFDYIEDKGVEREASYPYVGKMQPCRYLKRLVETKINGYIEVESGSERALHEAVATVGPVSIAIYVTPGDFQFYKSGVFDNPNCKSGNMDLNHGMLLVGYGNCEYQDYWLVKNSWGTDWGQDGYIMMSRNKDNQCGIASAASYPFINSTLSN